MTDLRTAAQQALEALNLLSDEGASEFPGTIQSAISDLEAALAQEQPNPPGCDHCNHPLYAATKCRVCGRVTERAEPVAWMDIDSDGQRLAVRQWSDGNRDEVPLYTAPPQRKPLTEGVLMGVYIDFDRAADPAWSKVEYLLQFARAIERAHEIGDNP